MFKPLIKKEEDKEVNSPSNHPSKMISMEDAHQMVEEAAELATQKSMEGFKKYQEQNQPVRQEIIEETGTDEDINVFNPKTQRAIKNTVQTLKSFNEAFSPPPNPISVAIENKMGEMAADFVVSKLGGGTGGSTAPKGVISSMLTDVLNTAFGHGLGESLGAGGAESIKTLIMSMSGQGGQGNTKQLSDGEKQQTSPDSNNIEKQKDQVLSLDVNNPEHIKNYAAAMGLSEKAAKEILTYHQQDIINERKLSSSGSPSSNNEMVQVTQALTTLINEMSGMKNTIINLNNEIVNLKGEKSVKYENSNRWNEENEQVSSDKNRQVNLFQEPIKVDVDSIKGENLKESFFNENQQIKEADVEEINEKNKPLEQVLDEKGDSHFRTLSSKENKKNVVKKEEVPKIVETETPKVEQKIEQTSKVRIIRKVSVKKEEPIKEETIKEEIKEEIPQVVVNETTNNETINNEKTV